MSATFQFSIRKHKIQVKRTIQSRIQIPLSELHVHSKSRGSKPHFLNGLHCLPTLVCVAGAFHEFLTAAHPNIRRCLSIRWRTQDSVFSAARALDAGRERNPCRMGERVRGAELGWNQPIPPESRPPGVPRALEVVPCARAG
jgi:hypothetical protein